MEKNQITLPLSCLSHEALDTFTPIKWWFVECKILTSIINRLTSHLVGNGRVTMKISKSFFLREKKAELGRKL